MGKGEKNQFDIPGGIRTRNLKIRSLTPYPLGHGDILFAFTKDWEKNCHNDTCGIRTRAGRAQQLSRLPP